MPYLSINHPIIKKKVKNLDARKQVIKVLTETWTANNIFCPNCWSKLSEQENNKKVFIKYASGGGSTIIIGKI